MPTEKDKEDHRARHAELHKALDELVADFIRHTGGMPSKATVMELIQWSHTQTIEATEVP